MSNEDYIARSFTRPSEFWIEETPEVSDQLGLVPSVAVVESRPLAVETAAEASFDRALRLIVAAHNRIVDPRDVRTEAGTVVCRQAR